MVVVEPTPRGDTAIVVEHDPLQALDVAIDEFPHCFWVVVRYLQLPLSKRMSYILISYP